ncbi:MAG TPA: CoA-transferase [Burkholderiales bacterium]|nr:CoA-transferase [Burkholderiales bacterium]
MEPFAREEFLACAIARLIGGAGHVAVGAASPIPAMGAFLSRAHNRNLRISLLHKRAGNPFTEGSRELFDLAGQGRIDVFFLGGAQIDGEANINLVRAEGKRFPGSFGSAFMYFTAGRTILFREEHSRRVLVPKVEFISAPGWSPPEVERRGGPQALLTGKALFLWQKDRRRFLLRSIHPGSSAEEIHDNTGFEYDVPRDIAETVAPSGQELRLIRDEVKKEIAANYPEFARRVWP